MIESTQLMGMAFFSSWVTLATLFAFAVICEGTDSRGWAVWWSLLTFVSLYILVDVPLATFGLYAIGYIVIGIIWSFIRYNRFVIKKHASIVRDANNYRNVDQRPEYISIHMACYAPDRMVSTITAWVIIWPVSMIENLPDDLYRYSGMFIKSVFGSLYRSSFDKITKGE